MATARASSEQFAHEACFYRDDREFLESTVPFVAAAVATGQPVLVALAEDKIGRVRDGLDARADQVSFVDMEQAGRNPGRLISVWHEFVDEHPGMAVRGVGEPVWPGRDPDELVECQQHEQLLNEAFASADGFRVRCPYDATRLPEEVLEEAARSHPVLCNSSGETPSTQFSPVSSESMLAAPLSPVPQHAERIVIDGETFASMRNAVRAAAEAQRVADMRLEDLVLAVTEAAANSVIHAGGGELSMWRVDHALVMQMHDRGRIEDPLVGRRLPAEDEPRGRGVWLVHQLCDLVQVRSGNGGTTVRMTIRL